MVVGIISNNSDPDSNLPPAIAAMLERKREKASQDKITAMFGSKRIDWTVIDDAEEAEYSEKPLSRLLKQPRIDWEAIERNEEEEYSEKPLSRLLRQPRVKLPDDDDDGCQEEVPTHRGIDFTKGKKIDLPTEDDSYLDDIPQEGPLYSELDLNPELAAMMRPDYHRMVKRRSLCGRYLGKKFQATSGRYYKGQIHCGLWRDGFCEKCLAHRSKRERKLVQSMVYRAANEKDEPSSVRMIEADDDGAKELTEGLTKEQYRRYPQKNGSTILFVDSDDLENPDLGEEVTWDSSQELEWESIVDTPDKKRITGCAGRGKSKIESEEKLIQVPHFEVDSATTPQQEVDALTATFKRTIHLNPKTAEELEAALMERTEVFIEELYAVGGKFANKGEITMKTEKVKISRIQWSSKVYDLFSIHQMVYVDKPPPKPPKKVD